MKRAWASLLCMAALSGCESAPEDPSNAELRALVENILAAAKDGQKERVNEFARGLLLPDHEAWFKRVLGEEAGTKLAAEYSKKLPVFEFENRVYFEALAGRRPTIDVTRMEVVPGEQPGEFGVAYIRGSHRGVASREKFEKMEKEVRKAAVLAMRNPVPLYEISFMSTSSRAQGSANRKPTHLRWIVRVDGAFRLVGTLEPPN